MRKGRTKQKGRTKKQNGQRERQKKRSANGAADACSKRTKAADALTAFVAESEQQKQIMLRLLGRQRLRHACIGSRRPVYAVDKIQTATAGKVPASWWTEAPEGPPPRDLYLLVGYRKSGRETDNANN